jgi:hypothetical protein
MCEILLSIVIYNFEHGFFTGYNRGCAGGKGPEDQAEYALKSRRERAINRRFERFEPCGMTIVG